MTGGPVGRAGAAGAEVPPRRPFVEPIYAVVRFDGSASKGVAEVVMAFESAAAADRFAAESGLDDYAVGPISFHVDPVAVQLGRQPR